MRWELNFSVLFWSCSSITWPCYDPDGPSFSCHRRACVWRRIRPSEICGVQSVTRTDFTQDSAAFPSSIIPPMLHTNLLLNTNVIRRTSGRSLGTVQVTLLLMSECTGGELTFALCLEGSPPPEDTPKGWELWRNTHLRNYAAPCHNFMSQWRQTVCRSLLPFLSLFPNIVDTTCLPQDCFSNRLRPLP